jgi:hypothetical protein
MSYALSNPYELTVGGVTCKASPFGAGSYVSDEDVEKLGDNAQRFKKALFEFYDVEQSKELKGIKVFGIKETGKKNG